MKQYQLSREFAEKWLSALRANTYKQARRKLYDPIEKGFCCLGVACSIVSIPKSFLLKNNTALLSSGQFDRKVLLPAGLKGDRDLNRALAQMNDNGKSFSEIADWIEENVEFI